ncbi:MAG: transglutaminase domain-containing protein [Lachnospiraceae bacterium]|nr:transglutaminase domain-containing protein [Lachnospiraceae bacterium]
MYEQYEKKMTHLAQVLRRTKKIALIVIALMIPILVFVFGVGFRYRDLSCESVYYGETPKPSSGFSAIAETTYEYRLADDKDSKWSEEVPRLPGRYEVRAHSVSILGFEKDSDSTEFEILPKELELWLPDYEAAKDPERVIISEENYSIGGLVYGDRVTGSTIEYPDRDKGGVLKTVRYCVGEVTIEHEDGTDATDCYKLPKKYGEITDTRTIITVEAESQTLKYNGDPFEFLHCDKWKITAGELKPGHTAEFHCVYENFAGVGSLYAVNHIDPERSCITDEDGNDVTDQYRIIYNDGNLSVERRSIIVTSGSASKPYDGTMLTCDEYTVDGDGLANGDSIEVRCDGYLIYPGTAANTIAVVKIVNDKYGDVSNYYSVVRKTGTLTVTGNKDDKDGKGKDGKGQQRGDGKGFTGEIDSAEEDGFDLSKNGFEFKSNGFGPGANMEPPIVFSFYGQSDRDYYFKEFSYGYYDGHSWYKIEGEEEFKPWSEYITGNNLKESGYSRDAVVIKDLKLKHLVYPYFMTMDPSVSDTDNKYTCETYVPGAYDWYVYSSSEREEQYREFVYANYTYISDDLRDALLALGAEGGISSYSDTYTLVGDIARYIQNAASYTMEFPDFPDDKDMVLYFLTESKQGICQHYAAAAAMMYRAYGIPSRFCVGLVQQGRPGQWTSVTANRGHAWVEVYLGGTGWVPVEVTGSDSGLGVGNGLIQGGDIFNWDYNDLYLLISYDVLSREYDGTYPDYEFTFNWHQTYGQLREGDTIVGPSYTLSGYELYKNVGEYIFTQNSVIPIKVIDANGKDVTYLYSISVNDPRIIITSRMLNLMIYADSDGNPNSVRWSITSGTLADGHTLRVLTEEDEWDHGVAVEIGSMGQRTVYVQVLDENGRNVTDNYTIDYRYATR